MRRGFSRPPPAEAERTADESGWVLRRVPFHVKLEGFIFRLLPAVSFAMLFSLPILTGSTRPEWLLSILLFILTFVYCEYLYRRTVREVVLTDRTFEVVLPGGARTFHWEEIESVRIGTYRGNIGIRIRARDGTFVIVRGMPAGLGRLRWFLERKVPPDACRGLEVLPALDPAEAAGAPTATHLKWFLDYIGVALCLLVGHALFGNLVHWHALDRQPYGMAWAFGFVFFLCGAIPAALVLRKALGGPGGEVRVDPNLFRMRVNPTAFKEYLDRRDPSRPRIEPVKRRPRFLPPVLVEGEQFRAGDEFIFQVKAGRFGWPWIASVRPAG